MYKKTNLLGLWRRTFSGFFVHFRFCKGLSALNFQPELRRGLDRLGRVGSLAWLAPSDAASHQHVAAVIASAADTLSRRRAGALIVVERDTGLGDMAETGVPLDATLSTDLLTTLFQPGSALHDGAAVVAGDKVVAAGVMLPLAQRMGTHQRYGTRHRAAVGVTEQTDALAIVVSEETGGMSLAERGKISHGLSEGDLRQRLFSRLNPANIGSTAASVRSLSGRQKAKTPSPDKAPATPVAATPAERDAVASIPPEDGTASTRTVASPK